MLTEKKSCFHCGRLLVDSVQNGVLDCCNYCRILASLLNKPKSKHNHNHDPRGNEAVEGKMGKEEEEEDGDSLNELLIFLFIVFVMGIVIFVYFWRDGANELFNAIKDRVENLF